MTKIKICGIRRLQDIEACNKYQPDFIGFIFFKGSKRYITLDEALELKRHLSMRIKSVGVFRDASIDEVVEVAQSGAIDLIQLHGHEDSNYIVSLRRKTMLPIIRAYIDDPLVKYLMYDNINPGSGEVCDWTKVKSDKPFFLAGGINASNVKEALKLEPYCIDVSTGVETNGYKDPKKIEELIRMVREE